MTSITNTTLRRSAIDAPEPRPVTLEFGRPGSAATVQTTPDTPGDVTAGADLEEAPGRDRSPADRGPELTLATPRSGTSEEPRGIGNGEPRGAGRAGRSGSDADGFPPGRPERENGGPRPRSNDPLASILDDKQNMNRFVDRLYRELERKTRIERERRGR